ncbi:MAG: hypothetical protein A2056_04505 [Deltaproteobacteria bacterium GWA2_42_85]|nr:MAG: hypothetical protein A2056_04505 [Deltaproteobacteria bacterium GWA2_42_85]OGQ66908.1 MAG: hypothetical protein A3F88_01740 [Deltaproteobacteria bacterium RIFCSPLOWO2_12_FULL_42_16]
MRIIIKMDIKELRKLWMEFEAIPVDVDDCIERDFYIWEKKTDKFHIWHWFDEKLPHGIAEWLV